MHKILSFSIFILILLVLSIAKCHAQKKEIPNDTTVIETLTSEQAKYISELDKEIARLNNERMKAYTFILSTKDSTYMPRLLKDPYLLGKKVYLNLKRIKK